MRVLFDDNMYTYLPRGYSAALDEAALVRWSSCQKGSVPYCTRGGRVGTMVPTYWS